MEGRPVGYLHNAVEELNSGLPRTNPDSGRLKDLNQGPPDFKSSTLKHSATPPPNSGFRQGNPKDVLSVAATAIGGLGSIKGTIDVAKRLKEKYFDHANQQELAR